MCRKEKAFRPKFFSEGLKKNLCRDGANFFLDTVKNFFVRNGDL